MEIKRILVEKTWEKFVLAQPHTPFLQSWAWGEFQEALGDSHFRIGAFKGEKPVGVASAILMRRKLGKFLYVPHGPLIEAEGNRARQTLSRQAMRAGRQEAGVEILEHLKKLAKEEGANYLRVEPNWEENAESRRILKEAGFRPAVSTAQARGTTLLLDLRPPEEELLRGMRETTRRRIRQGQRLGIEVQRSREPEMVEEFHRLMAVTSKRQGFTPHSRRYLQTQFEILAPRGMAELYLARYQGDVLATMILITYGDTATYVHGASVRSSVPASYILHWESIKQAKKADLDFYDFWGIAKTDDRRDPWYGITFFKKGFGGYQVDYVGAWDFPLTKRYLAVAGVERVRKLLRQY